MVPEQSMAGDGAPRLGHAARGGNGIWMDGVWRPLLGRAAVSRPSGGSGEPGCRDRRERRSRPRQSMMADASESLAKAQSPLGAPAAVHDVERLRDGDGPGRDVVRRGGPAQPPAEDTDQEREHGDMRGTSGAAAASAMSGSAQSPRALLLPMPAVRERSERDEEDVDTEDDKI